MDYEHPRSERMGHSARGRQVKRLESARAFVQSLALILRAGRRAREKRRLGKALFALKEEAVAARVARDRKAAQRAREVAAREAAISAGAAVTTAVLGRVRRQAVDRAFRIWQQACREATRKVKNRHSSNPLTDSPKQYLMVAGGCAYPSSSSSAALTAARKWILDLDL